jgi:hypothetical protein
MLLSTSVKAAAELVVKLLSSISSDRQSAALQGSLRAKRADDGKTARSHCPNNLAHVRPPVSVLGEEVEDRSVMPDVEAVCRQ